jgi:hypothetical protein
MTLISASEMLALQSVALSAMATTVSVYNKTINQTDDGQETTYPSTPSSVVQGMLYETTPDSATINVLNGAGGVAEDFWMLVPVDTDVGAGDMVMVGSTQFFVQNTSSDDTYQPALTLALRRITPP